MELSLENDIDSISHVKANLNLFKMVAEGEESLKKGKQVSLQGLKSKLSKKWGDF